MVKSTVAVLRVTPDTIFPDIDRLVGLVGVLGTAAGILGAIFGHSTDLVGLITIVVLVGLGRFVEEHLRGEPQTLVVAGLRLYQWLAMAFVVGGAVLTTLGSTAAPTAPRFDPGSLAVAVVVGAICYIAYGVDFPGSNRRFSRLR